MISGLKGTLKKLEVGFAHIETGGITYEVTISFKTYLELKGLPSHNEIQFQIFHAMSERGQKLFGFLTEQDKEFFKVIKGLQGIGELTALKILSFFQRKNFIESLNPEKPKNSKKFRR
ncbi:Holliday junction DNA helicase RuvA, N-terminal domain protein [Leptospira weilii serovar Topaz str. LT2116]|uniref:Holliday junction DNA helicase RuvA, N-terminal domain protein n=1 Tax=Leptospira weilii serovar Topaz str. LT2116 TaxID=1088540 RepID=M3ERN5_9LEPT|nr:Holliday junction DNA helicase RuvA, N-terminal domain protein [Leptospira weilii serovar Topaz str. LT2116]